MLLKKSPKIWTTRSNNSHPLFIPHRAVPLIISFIAPNTCSSNENINANSKVLRVCASSLFFLLHCSFPFQTLIPQLGFNMVIIAKKTRAGIFKKLFNGTLPSTISSPLPLHLHPTPTPSGPTNAPHTRNRAVSQHQNQPPLLQKAENI